MKQIITQELKKNNITLNPKGIDAIMFQVELLYGKQATTEQIKEIVEQNSIEFLNENRK